VNACQLGRFSQDGRASGCRGGGASAGCHGGVGPDEVNCCHAGRSSPRADSQGGVVLGWVCRGSPGCCHDGVASGGCQLGAEPAWSSVAGVGHAVPEMAGSRVGASACGGMTASASPLCHASVVVRQPCVPEAERHSVVCFQRALSAVERHSEVWVRQPTPSAGSAGRPVAATSDQRLTVPDDSPGVSGFCAHASARKDQATASGIGCMLPVSAGEPVPQTVAPGSATADESGSSGRFVGVQESGALLSRGRRAP
jgi:hypothetical protein